jgi:transposase-like protein
MARRPDPDRESFWRELVARRESSDLTVSELCGQAGVSTASFFFWQRRLRKQKPARRSGTIEALAHSSLLPVRIVPDRADEGRAPPVVVDLPGAIRVQIPPGCDASTIHAVLEAVSMLHRGGPPSC